MFTCCEPRAVLFTARAKDKERPRAHARAVRESWCTAAPGAPRAVVGTTRGKEVSYRERVSRFLVAALRASTGCKLRNCVLEEKQEGK